MIAAAAAECPFTPGQIIYDEQLGRERAIGQHFVAYRDPESGDWRLLYNPQPRQDELHAAAAPNIMYGGQAGGGKSHGARWHGIKACMRIPRLRVLVLRRNLTDLQKSHLIDLPTELPLISSRNPHGIAVWREQQKQLWFPHPAGPSGENRDSLLQFGHVQDEAALGAYLSSQWDIIILDEGSLFTPRMLRMLRTRLRTKNLRIRPQFIVCTNPGGPGHLWLKQRFVDKKVPEGESRGYLPSQWHFITSAVEDNAYLDADQYDTQFSELSEAEYRAYRKGDWDAFAGQFFTEWSRAVHVIPKDQQFPIPDWWERQGCMDWGYAPNPGYIAWGAIDEHGRTTGYREIVFEQCSASEVAQLVFDALDRDPETGEILETVLRMQIQGDSQMWVTQADSGVSIAEEFNLALSQLCTSAGAQASPELVQAVKERINGWHRMHSHLKPTRPQPEGTVGPWARWFDENDDTGLGCPYLIGTIGSQMFDEKKANGDMLKGPTDHGCDAWRYYFISREPLTAVPVALKPGKPHVQRVHQATRLRMLKMLQRHNAELETDQLAAAGDDVGVGIPGLEEALGAGGGIDEDTLETLGDVTGLWD